MKTLRYLLIVLGLVSFLGVSAQGLAQQPEATMQSTSIMQGSGSALPSAAVEGVSTTYSPAHAPSGPRRGFNPGGGGGEPGDRPEPYETPIGDAMIPLALLAVAYFGYRLLRRKKRA